ncbi:hypothetical protein HMPREF3224_02120, partial [Anaerococcus hydrogenalis]
MTSPENEEGNYRRYKSDADDVPETDHLTFPRHARVDAPQAEYRRRHGEQYRHRCEQLHDLAQVVADDGSKRVHHAVRVLRIHLNHFDRLLVFDDDIFEQIFILLVHLQKRARLHVIAQAQETLHHDAVRFERAGEIRERFRKFE